MEVDAPEEIGTHFQLIVDGDPTNPQQIALQVMPDGKHEENAPVYLSQRGQFEKEILPGYQVSVDLNWMILSVAIESSSHILLHWDFSRNVVIPAVVAMENLIHLAKGLEFIGSLQVNETFWVQPVNR